MNDVGKLVKFQIVLILIVFIYEYVVMTCFL